MYYLELLMPAIIKLLQRTKNKITKNKNCENQPHLKITEAILLHFSTVNNDCQHEPSVFYSCQFINSLIYYCQ